VRPGPVRARARRHGAAAGLALLLLAAVPASAAYEVADVPDAGAVSGIVRFAGAAPLPRTPAVTQGRPGCADARPAEALVVDAAGGVKGGVITIEGVSRGKTATGELVLDHDGCAFVPHVGATMAGGRVRVRNSDAIAHHARASMGPAPVFNVALPDRGQEIDVTKRLATPGVVHVVCGAHPHMSAWIVVHDSPYVAVTDERGAYRIDGVPPGTYTVRLWHEGFRRKGTDRDGRPVYGEPKTIARSITVAPRATATADFVLR
jgi:plastocyanin